MWFLTCEDAHFIEHRECECAREAVGAEADVHADAAQFRERKSCMAEVAMTAWAMHDAWFLGHRGEQREVRIVQFIHVSKQPSWTEAGVCGDVCEWRALLLVVEHPTPELLHELVQFAAFFPEHLPLFSRFGDVCGHWHPQFFRRIRCEFVEFTTSGVRRVRTEAETTKPVGALIKKSERAGNRLLASEAMADINHFKKPPCADGRRRHIREQFGERFDVRHRRRAPLFQFGETLGDCIAIIVVIQAAFERVDTDDPFRESALWINRAPHHRVIEMAMRVHQPRHQHLLA